MDCIKKKSHSYLRILISNTDTGIKYQNDILNRNKYQ